MNLTGQYKHRQMNRWK